MDVETDLLIVGTGPAGAALACFLASHGLRGIMIGMTRGSIDTPRAHITNMAALECLRDIGLEEDCMRDATQNECMQHTRWCNSMTGEEYARIYSWGNDPARHGDYDAASPCTHVDLPQTLLEPILVRYATRTGFNCRFDSVFVSFTQDASGKIHSIIEDQVTKSKYTIISKYLFACDGARSRIMRQLDIPLDKKPGQGLAFNILAEVDLSEHIKHRNGNLHYLMQPDREYPDFAWTAIVRMVKPWHEWMFIMFPAPGSGTDLAPTREECLKRVKEMIGDDSIPVEILDVSKWLINEIVATRYSEGNIYCLGDAVHRHPPINGLGSNTCIQDAYNLAWKIAYVIKGVANPSILETYSIERQPVGRDVITRANQGLRDHIPVWEALGMMEPDLEKRKAQLAELSEDSPAGRARREKLQTNVLNTAHEFHGVGVEMNQRYESRAIYTADEGPRPPLPADPILHHEITTHPGSRLPHAWLNSKIPGPPLSTIDLAGHGAFSLITGIGGNGWKDAATAVSKKLNVEIRAYSIGWRQDYEDAYFDWSRRREIDEDGCVLVRPDRFVAWRSKNAMKSGAEEKLLAVMRSVLGL